MRAHSPARAILAAASAACLLLVSSPLFAGWEESYRKGKEAYEQGKMGEAIRQFREAIKDKSEEKASAIKVSGMFFESYLPHFYLGMALFNHKEYKDAADELAKSESMKVILKSKDLYAQLKQTKSLSDAAAAAAAPPSQPPPAPAQAPAQIAQQQPSPPPAGEPAAPTPSKPAEPPPSKGGSNPVSPQVMTSPKPAAPSGPDPALAAAVNAAAVDIAAVEKLKVESGRYLEADDKARMDGLVSEIRAAQSPSTVTARRQELQKTVADLRTKVSDRKRQEEAKAKEDEARQAALSKNKALKDAMDRATPAVQEAESFGAANRSILQGAEWQRLTGRVDAVRNATTPDALNSAAQALRTELASLKKTVGERGASNAKLAQQQYARGVQAYFEGKYDDALPALEQAASALTKDADPSAYLGCALYRKYLLSRPADAALKSRAEQAFRSAIAIKRDYSLDAKTFPPKVVAFFKDVSARR